MADLARFPPHLSLSRSTVSRRLLDRSDKTAAPKASSPYRNAVVMGQPTPALLGTRSQMSNLYSLIEPRGKRGCFFVFPDLVSMFTTAMRNILIPGSATHREVLAQVSVVERVKVSSLIQSCSFSPWDTKKSTYPNLDLTAVHPKAQSQQGSLAFWGLPYRRLLK